ncbi:hypothetical protein DAPPUDRAFT_240789 [Daphnia pulex]|uniref:Uncharacterized protein n=1 Tax=Daphnia pulex TaxID=6669 RepID=E9GCK3_DAPPU|nr:hypothetical protein DAPPUDRAFT_240789 [Daphnia pulex]|eukprot:EFX82571.1 hypothetical protein DAPPUDRAFT_240789 [Daphnia pulex]
MPQLLVQKVGFFVKDVREDDAHEADDVKRVCSTQEETQLILYATIHNHPDVNRLENEVKRDCHDLLEQHSHPNDQMIVPCPIMTQLVAGRLQYIFGALVLPRKWTKV